MRRTKKKGRQNEEGNLGRTVGGNRVSGGLLCYQGVSEGEERRLWHLPQVGSGLHKVPGGRLSMQVI